MRREQRSEKKNEEEVDNSMTENLSRVCVYKQRLVKEAGEILRKQVRVKDKTE